MPCRSNSVTPRRHERGSRSTGQTLSRLSRARARELKVVSLLLILSVSGLFLSSVVRRASGVSQMGTSYWSPFGPQMQQVIMNVYTDCATIINQIALGQVDVEDCDVGAANAGGLGLSANPDLFVTLATGGVYFAALNAWNWEPSTQSSLVSVSGVPILSGQPNGYGFQT